MHRGSSSGRPCCSGCEKKSTTVIANGSLSRLVGILGSPQSVHPSELRNTSPATALLRCHCARNGRGTRARRDRPLRRRYIDTWLLGNGSPFGAEAVGGAKAHNHRSSRLTLRAMRTANTEEAAWTLKAYTPVPVATILQHTCPESPRSQSNPRYATHPTETALHQPGFFHWKHRVIQIDVQIEADEFVSRLQSLSTQQCHRIAWRPGCPRRRKNECCSHISVHFCRSSFRRPSEIHATARVVSIY